jgi:hypothetical protein
VRHSASLERDLVGIAGLLLHADGPTVAAINSFMNAEPSAETGAG